MCRGYVDQAFECSLHNAVARRRAVDAHQCPEYEGSVCLILPYLNETADVCDAIETESARYRHVVGAGEAREEWAFSHNRRFCTTWSATTVKWRLGDPSKSCQYASSRDDGNTLQRSVFIDVVSARETLAKQTQYRACSLTECTGFPL